MMESNYFFIKKYSSRQEQKERYSCNLYIARNEEYQFIDKNCTQENFKYQTAHEELV